MDSDKLVSAEEARGLLENATVYAGFEDIDLARLARTVIALHARAEQSERERDEARRMLGECYVLSGADTDGNPPESVHVWPYAVQAVQELREEYDEACEEAPDPCEAIVRFYRG